MLSMPGPRWYRPGRYHRSEGTSPLLREPGRGLGLAGCVMRRFDHDSLPVLELVEEDRLVIDPFDRQVRLLIEDQATGGRVDIECLEALADGRAVGRVTGLVDAVRVQH